MSSTANSEQLKAIEHRGGVLLSAGAGSGKTFVLTEHLIYLTNLWIEEFKTSGFNDFSPWIKERYSQVVMMTFTNKAAGEILIRIKDKFTQKTMDNSNAFWHMAFEQIESVTISTIHGFCLKLIQMGLLPKVPSQIDVISDIEFDILINKIADTWFERHVDIGGNEINYLLRVKDEVIESLKSIISDPILRLKWLGANKKVSDEQLDSICAEMFVLNDFILLGEKQVHIEGLIGAFKKPWEEELLSFFSRFELRELNYKMFLEICEFFQQRSFKIPTTPRAKNIPEDVIAYYKIYKELKDYCKKNYDDFICFDEFGDIASIWYELLHDLISFTSEQYNKEGKLTFGDLEYLSYINLRDYGAGVEVAKQFNYIIVDEFQDTSSMQFEIIDLILGGNLQNLFCVGDLKQAIYGFRGGELEVFQKVEKLIPLNLSLNNNYRSLENIIHFNNDIFSFLFKKSFGYEGVDPFQVEVTHQLSPLDGEAKGLVQKITPDLSFLSDEEKLNNADLDYIEALSLVEAIKEAEAGTIAILYKKLKPSQLLVKLLIAEKIGFTSQIKIPFLEDPIIGLFYEFINYKLNVNEMRGRLLDLSIKSYLRLMGKRLSLESDFATSFNQDEELYGLYNAFIHFINKVGINISQYANNLYYIKNIIKASVKSYEKIYQKLSENSTLAYSTEFQFGENAQRVSIMSAHASKGLEFDNVFLGGIYTNDKSITKTPLLGKIPLSFKWKISAADKRSLKTPYYIIEELRTSYKEFSEAKRLFYVAATRAQKTLSWCDLSLEGLKSSVGKNTWANALKVYEENLKGNLIKRKNVTIEKVYSNAFLESVEMAKPLFHERRVGITTNNNCSKLLFLSEMSVTRLAKITKCSFCFYLEQILKLNLENQEKYDYESADEDLTSHSFRSSAKRGIEIHDEISQVILGNFDLTVMDLKNLKQVTWTVDKITKECGEATYVSEKQIKFPVFNFMISGIPDLIILPKNKSHVQIWDFKTGKIAPNESYWFQLMTYAYAMFIQKKTPNPIKLVLCYVDEETLLEKIVSRNDVENYLWSYWEKIESPKQYRDENCQVCTPSNFN